MNTISTEELLQSIADDGAGTVVVSIGTSGGDPIYHDADMIRDLIDRGYDWHAPEGADPSDVADHFGKAGVAEFVEGTYWLQSEHWFADDAGYLTGQGIRVYLWNY